MMLSNKVKAVSVLSATALVVALSALFAPVSKAATVPNQYACSRWTDKCVQSNGKHVNGLPDACYWTWNVYTSGSSTAICNSWE
jgi:hypothetical protein